MLCAAYSLLQATPKDTGLLPALNGVELLLVLTLPALFADVATS